jgi:chromosome segregation protein
VFLKSLTVRGFKSFADKTVLDFEPGVTVVVGPNGSGKSNLVDAVAWVLGAQGVRALRGGKMDDVIFAGTADRPALGRAEVSLTIDNTAGVLPIEFSEVTVTRTLFRTGESEYAINGAPCRLLDIQELLSDTGIGRQQHVIVGQGQLDAVLNSRPEDRRAVIEEAAGVLKFRKRREKAQRRLESTEANLLRLTDLLREVRRQLRPLERQADAARRHDGLVAELGAIRLHLAGREIDALGARLERHRNARVEHAAADAEVRARLRELDAAVVDAERALSIPGADDVADLLPRVEALRERARGLHALVAERRRGLERELVAVADEGVVETLVADAAALRAELTAVDSDWATLAPTRDEAEASEHDASRARAALEAAVVALDAAVREREAADELLRRLEAEEIAARAAQRAAAERAATDAEERLRRTAEEASRWHARAEALALTLDDAHHGSGMEVLAGVEGVIGPLVDVIEIEAGAEVAVGAGLGEALRALVVESGVSARRAVERLKAGDVGALLLVAEDSLPRAQGMLVPPGCQPLADFVRGTAPGVDRVLERLLDRFVLVDAGWAAAVDLALSDPGLVAVTRQGDRFGAAAWRAGAAGTAAVTPAALDEAREQAAAAARALDAAAAAADAARAVLARARGAELDAVLAAGAGEPRASGTGAEGSLDQVERARVTLEAAQHAERAAAEALQAARSEHERLRSAAVALRRDYEVRGAGLDERRSIVAKRLADVEARLAARPDEEAAARRRRAALEHKRAAIAAIDAAVVTKAADIDDVAQRLRRKRQEQSEAARAAGRRLDTLRAQRADAERTLAEVRERANRAEVDETEVRLRLEAAVEMVRRDFDCEPEIASASPLPDVPEGVTPAARARELERELRLMGPVNPLALSEYEALVERHDFLEQQLDDVKSSRRELTRVIRAVDAEIVSVFEQAFADVSTHFSALFATLFPGGAGRVVLTDPANLLDTGIEIEARPSGKTVRRLSLLSGGERSLAALAFLFAVFRARPSPFYLMDEVEAALDDVNLHRFLDLVHEFRAEAQLLIVSHQKRTMEAADILYGVSMPPGGSSRVVSQRMRDLELEDAQH